MTIYSNLCCQHRGYQKRPEILCRKKLCFTTGKTGEQISALGNSSEWYLFWKFFTELFTPKPRALNLCQTRSGLILEEFSKQLPFDQIGSFSAATAVVWGWPAGQLTMLCWLGISLWAVLLRTFMVV